jgi:hypothetical protein
VWLTFSDKVVMDVIGGFDEYRITISGRAPFNTSIPYSPLFANIIIAPEWCNNMSEP